ncbi:MAG: GerAB/ArcD/ProY family transporter [Bacillota bacterium]
MLREGKFGFYEAFALLLISNWGRLFLSLPAVALEEGKNMAWVFFLVGTVNDLLIFWLITLLMKGHQDLTIVEVSERVLGPYLGTVVNLVFAGYFLMVDAVITRGFAEAFLITALPRTPISVVLFVITAASFISCFYGLEAIARVARTALTFIVLGMFILILTVASFADVTNFYPLWSMDPMQLLAGSWSRYTVITEGLLAAVIFHAFGGWQHFRRAGMWAIAVGGLVVILAVVFSLLVFGVQAASEFSLPLFELSRIVIFGRFFQRLESVFLLVWAMVGFIKLAITLYAYTLVFARMFRLPDYRPLLAVTSLLSFVISILPPDLPSAIRLENDLIRSWGGLVATVALPVLLLAVSKLRKMGGQAEDGTKVEQN